jgi:hypothetical protein
MLVYFTVFTCRALEDAELGLSSPGTYQDLTCGVAEARVSR